MLAEAVVIYGTAELIQSWFWQKQAQARSPPQLPLHTLNVSNSAADEIAKLKALVDGGAITHREFKKRKKAILKRL